MGLVDIGECRRVDHDVEEGGVEDGAGISVTCFDGDAFEGVVPGLVGSLGGGVEVPSGKFGCHVCLGSFVAGRGEGYLHEDLRAFSHLAVIETDEPLAEVGFRHVGRPPSASREIRHGGVDYLSAFGGSLELSMEPNPLVLCPS